MIYPGLSLVNERGIKIDIKIIIVESIDATIIKINLVKLFIFNKNIF